MADDTSDAVESYEVVRPGNPAYCFALAFLNISCIEGALAGLAWQMAASGILSASRIHAVSTSADHEAAFVQVVTDPIPGSNMLDWLAVQSEMTEHTVARVFRAAVEAVRAVHSTGLIHCNLEADAFRMTNMTPDAEIALAGWELVTKKENPWPMTVGVLAYSAPEVLKEHPEYSEKSDTWSLGVLLFVMLCGKLPFPTHATLPKHAHDDHLQEAIMTESIAWSDARDSGLSDAAMDLLHNLLTASPDKRMSLESAASHPWVTNPSTRSASIRVASQERLQAFNQSVREALRLPTVRQGLVTPWHELARVPGFTRSQLRSLRDRPRQQSHDGRICLESFERVMPELGHLPLPPAQIFRLAMPSKDSSSCPIDSLLGICAAMGDSDAANTRMAQPADSAPLPNGKVDEEEHSQNAGFLAEEYESYRRVIELEDSRLHRFEPLATRKRRSDLDPRMLVTIQRGKEYGSYRGAKMLKDPLDLQLMSELLFELQPRTVLEFGTFTGASAVWIADQLRSCFHVDAEVHTFDVCSDLRHPALAEHPHVTYHIADLSDPVAALPREWLQSLPHPWLVVEDAHCNLEGLLHYLHTEALEAGDYVVVEDTCPDMPSTFLLGKEESPITGNESAVAATPAWEACGTEKLDQTHRFFDSFPEMYRVDTRYTDRFGYNGTWNWDGYIKRIV